MKNIFLPVFCFLLFSSTLFSQIIASIEFDGLTRGYLLDLPSDYEAYEKLPLVLNFHGYTSNNIQQRLYSGMTTVADTGNFIVCYPQGIADSWNVGWNFGSNEDDVGFVNALIDTLATNYNVNLDAVFSTGMSNGGFMSYKLACDLNPRIKAIASVTGSMHSSEVQSCTPENPIPIMQIHGTADNVVFYNGNPTVNIGIEELLANWLQWNNCMADSDTIAVPNIDPNDGTTSQRIEYNNCDGNSRIVFYKIFGGQHTWPGASINVGVTSQDFNASSEIWNFFRSYTPPLIVSTKAELQTQVSITVSPNPFGDIINIDAKGGKLKNLQVFNAIGQKIFQTTLRDESSFEIPSSNFAYGIYFVQVETEEGMKVIKIVKH